MPISEADISIVIPTYRYRDRVMKAVQSALESGAGEIIVVDDHSRDGTAELLAEIDDPRLIFHENEQNVGLWENHLKALGIASKPWIKFVQADDYLLPGGLAKMAAAADEGVSVVWANPTYIQAESGEPWAYYSFEHPRRLDSAAMIDLLMRVGWLLGSPSQMLLRADVIERNPEIWTPTKSTDLIVGAIAVCHGDTVLIPEGAVVGVCHDRQNTATQGVSLALQRALESMVYLRMRPEPELKRLAAGFTAYFVITWTRNLMAVVVRRQKLLWTDITIFWALLHANDAAAWRMAARNSRKTLSAVKRAWLQKYPIAI